VLDSGKQVGDGDPAPLSGAPVAVHRWAELVDGRPTTYDWPEVDERDAAALCYTSGTTGNPKGVAYSHRSIWLHSMQVCSPEAFGLTGRDKVLGIPGVKTANIEVVFDPPWTQAMMSDAAKLQLGMM